MDELVVITTGGTIACRCDHRGVRRPDDLQIDWHDDAYRLRMINVMNKDSSALQPHDWVQISRMVTQSVDQGARGVVITHGTDSLEETALWVELTYGGNAPVVITGAQRPQDDPDSDGGVNLSDALALASSPQGYRQGVMVSFAGKIFSPWGLQKIHTQALCAFAGKEVGRICGREVCLASKMWRPFLGQILADYRVDIVDAYPGADGVVLQACVDAGAKAIVINGLGAGNVDPCWMGQVRSCIDQGVAVLVCSRVPFGPVGPFYGPGDELAQAGAIFACGLRASQARVVAIAALGAHRSVSEFIHQVCQNLEDPSIQGCLVDQQDEYVNQYQ